MLGLCFFSIGAGGSFSSGQSANKRSFNEGTCKFGTVCKFKHEYSGCGGSHSFNRCAQKGKGRPGELATLVNIARMRSFLGRYPNRDVADLLASGFAEGFQIPYSHLLDN